jgi:uncharacterized protein YciI
MKFLCFVVFVTFLATGSFAQTNNPLYDSVLAKKLNADEYGMKAYVLVILKTGSNTTTEKSFVDSCFKGHMANIKRMVDEGNLCVAGPMGKNEKSYRGIFIMNVKTFDEAKALMKNDPAIESKILEAEMYNWYGSAALPEYLDASDKVWKIRH